MLCINHSKFITNFISHFFCTHKKSTTLILIFHYNSSIDMNQRPPAHDKLFKRVFDDTLRDT